LYEEWWFMPERAELRVGAPGGIAVGEHDVEVALSLRIPYVFVKGGSEIAKEVTICQKRLTCVNQGRLNQ